jgi:hypothetical protein
MVKQKEPNKSLFQSLIDVEIDLTLNLKYEEVVNRDSYSQILHSYLGSISEDFLIWEGETTAKLENKKISCNLFNALNRETLPYATQLLSQDIKNLTNSPERIYDFVHRNHLSILLLLMNIFVFALTSMALYHFVKGTELLKDITVTFV